MRIIDIHSHILSGVDDGASSEKESLQMLKMAVKQGMTGVIATPHYSVNFRNTNAVLIRQQCRQLEEKLQQSLGEQIRIYPGQEIFYSEEVIDLLDKGKLLTLADSPYVLVEFHPAAPYSFIFSSLRNLVYAKYSPILAHVERYSVLRKKGRPEELIDMGAELQMNYRSIGGKWYHETPRWCRYMLKEGNIQYLGTDMHNVKERRPDVTGAEAWLKKHLDLSYIKAITYGNAEKILAYRNMEKRRKDGE